MEVKVINTYKEKIWYKNEIGNVFTVSPQIIELNGHDSYQVIQSGTVSRLCLNVNDCKVLN